MFMFEPKLLACGQKEYAVILQQMTSKLDICDILHLVYSNIQMVCHHKTFFPLDEADERALTLKIISQPDQLISGVYVCVFSSVESAW